MKAETRYRCTECGYETPRWMGRCPVCGAWGTLKEVKVSSSKPQRPGTQAWLEPQEVRPVPLVPEAREAQEARRWPTGIQELDRVLGGGLVAGSVVLLGGEPGVGKSTLLLQLARALAEGGVAPVLYGSAEESRAQILERARRLGIAAEGVQVAPVATLEDLLSLAEEIQPRVLLVDSIQAIITPELPSVAGSVAQVRECASALLRLAKTRNIAVILVGHVTKDGTLAGPKTLEHMVDVVLYLEEQGSGLRVLRASKNRYGSTDEIGLFEMTGTGLREIRDPGRIFLSTGFRRRSGVVITAVLEGRRPFLVEIEALVARTPFALPQRVTTGYDPKRLSMLLGLLENRLGLSLRGHDVFLNVAGGLRIRESAADLAVVAAVLSSFKKRALPEATLVLGEVGLTGEVRPIPALEIRLREAARLGFHQAIVPPQSRNGTFGSLKILEVSDVKELMERWFS